MTNLILICNGFKAKYPVADKNRVGDTILSVFKYSFAEKITIKSWIEENKLTRSNFYIDDSGKASSLNYESLSEENKKLFAQQLEQTIANIKVGFEE